MTQYELMVYNSGTLCSCDNYFAVQLSK